MFLSCSFHVPFIFLSCSFHFPFMFLSFALPFSLLFLSCSFHFPFFSFLVSLIYIYTQIPPILLLHVSNFQGHVSSFGPKNRRSFIDHLCGAYASTLSCEHQHIDNPIERLGSSIGDPVAEIPPMDKPPPGGQGCTKKEFPGSVALKKNSPVFRRRIPNMCFLPLISLGTAKLVI